MWLPLSHSHTGDVVLNRVLHEDSHCRLSLDHVVQGAELVATVSGVGVVWTSGSGTSTTANFTFDLQAFSVREEREVTLSLGEVWGGGSGSVLLDNLTLYPCTLCPAPPSEPLHYVCTSWGETPLISDLTKWGTCTNSEHGRPTANTDGHLVHVCKSHFWAHDCYMKNCLIKAVN